MVRIRERLADYARILRIARKPTQDEFLTSAKVTSLGLLVIGAIGFAIFIAFVLSCSMAGFLC
ncbi:MAG: protein translocase SEC61 complex subunit gamma [Candidatus Aenigmarchaeota archaeon]|nr:protein translocase SEC61 complex subunit gamma [Candidatus Aenigmarchaeota archaeon]